MQVVNILTTFQFAIPVSGLHWSCKLARIDMARVLIEAGSDVNARSHSGQTPLHLAAQTGKGEVIDLLLRCGKKIVMYLGYIIEVSRANDILFLLDFLVVQVTRVVEEN